MKKVFVVARYELLNTVFRVSFLLATFGLPLFSGMSYWAIHQVNEDPQLETTQLVEAVLGEEAGNSNHAIPEGLVDLSGLIRMLPASVTSEDLRIFETETSAQKAIQAGEITAYYLVTPNYMETGEVIYVRPDLNYLSAIQDAEFFQAVLYLNLLGGNETLAKQVEDPFLLTVKILEPTSDRDMNDPLTMFPPYIVAIFFYMTIFTSASVLLSGLNREKQNRVMEILMSAISPRQMLAGKIIGLGIAGLFQMVLWSGTAYLLLQVSGRTFDIPEYLIPTSSFMIWGLVYFLLGYGLYASMLAGFGALVPNLREASQYTMIFLIPLIMPPMMFYTFVRDPNGVLATAMSLFPLTAPVAMMTRLAASNTVPLWQSFLSVIILGITTIGVILLAARLFRSQVLLSGQKLSLGLLWQALTSND